MYILQKSLRVSIVSGGKLRDYPGHDSHDCHDTWGLTVDRQVSVAATALVCRPSSDLFYNMERNSDTSQLNYCMFTC